MWHYLLYLNLIVGYLQLIVIRLPAQWTVPTDYKHKTTVGYFKNLTLESTTTDNNKSTDQWDPRSILPLSISAGPIHLW